MKFPVWQRILIGIERGCDYGNGIAKTMDITYSCVSNNLKELVKMSLITSNVKGRKILIKATEKGKKIGQVLNEHYRWYKRTNTISV